MKFLSENGVSKFWSKIKSFFIQSDTIRKIVIVDEYPEVEEEGVLYLKKYTPTNLYYQDVKKSGGSESSGYLYNYYTDCTVDFDSVGVALTSDKERDSNNFFLNLTAGKKYRVVFTYISGEVSGLDGTLITFIFRNGDTSTVLAQSGTTTLSDVEFTYTATAMESFNARIGLYAYTGGLYNALKYKIAIYEE